MRKKYIVLMIVMLFLCAVPGAACAAEADTDVALAVDTIWTLIAAFLVFFMQAGFAMVETGLTRAKNAGNIIMKNLMDFAIGSIAYFAVGFALMFGRSLGGVIGVTGFGLSDAFEHLGLGIPLSAFVIFQTVFAATAATIVSGPCRAHQVHRLCDLLGRHLAGHLPGGGPLDLERRRLAGPAGLPRFRRFHGGALGGRLGRAHGRFDHRTPDRQVRKDREVTRHPRTLHRVAALGVFILWFGWFGFNPGSSLSGMASQSIGQIAMTTNLSAAAARRWS
jgi:Amt family ammonium transporter